MPSSGMLRRVSLLKTDVSEELRASVIKVTRTSELGTLTVTAMRCTVRGNTI
jgi:beta-lactamase superfamily II metal-dependent hydrolase